MKIEEMSLEQAMDALENAVKQLEDEETSLDKSIENFEQGVKLVAHCKALLDGYEKRITVLKKNAQGEIEEVEDERNDF